MVDNRAKAGTLITEEAAATTRALLTEVDTEAMRVVGNPRTEEHSTKALPDGTAKAATVNIKAMEVLKEVPKGAMALPKVNTAAPKEVTEVLREDRKVKTKDCFASVRGHTSRGEVGSHKM